MTDSHAQHGKNGSTAPATPIPTLDVRAQLEGSRLLVLGGTGFLGKIFWVMMLARYPERRPHLPPRPQEQDEDERAALLERDRDERVPRAAAHAARRRLRGVPRRRRSSRSTATSGSPNCGIDAALAQGARGAPSTRSSTSPASSTSTRRSTRRSTRTRSAPRTSSRSRRRSATRRSCTRRRVTSSATATA